MQLNILKVTVLLGVLLGGLLGGLLFSLPGFTQTSQQSKPRLKNRGIAQEEPAALPCMQVKKACELAGYSKGTAKSQKTVRDCMARLNNGETLSDVNISAQIIEACKEKREGTKDKK